MITRSQFPDLYKITKHPPHRNMFSLKFSTIFVIISTWLALENDAQRVFSAPAIFERLSHFKDAGLVNELNTVDQAMIADGTYRMLSKGIITYNLIIIYS